MIDGLEMKNKGKYRNRYRSIYQMQLITNNTEKTILFYKLHIFL